MSKRLSLFPYQYKTIQAKDFYSLLLKVIDKNSNIKLEQAKIHTIKELKNGVVLQAEFDNYKAKKVFDSRLPKINNNEIGVLQHFLGQVIKVDKPTFLTDEFTMMDFRVNEKDTTSFIYVLPYSETSALVEFTYFSNEVPPKETYREYITQYCKEILQLTSYEIVEEEYGIIPMLMQDFSKGSTQNIIKIGTAGGMVKPSSGYSFQRSKWRANQIVNLLMNKQKIPLDNYHNRHRFYDKIFLSILQDYNRYGEQLFTTMYTKNNVETMFNFLDETSNLKEELTIISSFARSKELPLFLQKLFTTF